MDQEKSKPFRIPPDISRKVIRILCIDGGGIRGIVPGIMLEFLESQLQDIDGKEARIADYFDVIAGTSTGGLITAMLTAPNEDNRPMFAAKDIKDFYLEHCPKIFPQRQRNGVLGDLVKCLKEFSGPIYNGKYLHSLLKEKLGNTKLHETLTNIVIPTFDIKRLRSVIFSNYEVKIDPSLDASLSDICIGTSAAPTYFPAHYFETKDSEENSKREFHLIDGGVALNNPTLSAISQVMTEINRGSCEFSPINLEECGRFLVLSLGTGSTNAENKYNAKRTAKWGICGWLFNGGGSSTPILDILSRASSDLVDSYISAFSKTVHSQGNYLRIQDESLTGVKSSVDVATKKNLNDLVKVGEDLLKKPIARVNSRTGIYESISKETNEQALIRLAQLLSAEKLLRDRHCESPFDHRF